MPPVTLSDSAAGSQASIAPDLGFNCFQWRVDLDGEPVDVIDASPDFDAGRERPGMRRMVPNTLSRSDGPRDENGSRANRPWRPSGHGIPLLFPFPNRIREARFTWNGREYELPASLVGHDPQGNAIHGFCLDRPWRVTAQGDHFVVGEFRLSRDALDRRDLWPADFLIEVRYELRGNALRTDVRIANPDTEPLPWGFGTHPYFRLPLSPRSTAGRCLIEVPAAEEWELIDCLPTGTRRPVAPERDLREGARFADLSLDDVLTGLKTERQHAAPQHAAPASVPNETVECTIYDDEAGLQLVQRFDAAFREVVVYTPPGRDVVCIEPYTCTTDAIHLQALGVDAGLRVLAPGAEFRTWIEMRVGEILV